MSRTPKVAIQISADPSGARRGLQATEKELRSFRGRVRTQFSSLGSELKGSLGAQLAGALSLGVVAAGLRASFQASDALEASNRKLATTATLTGQNLGFLQKTAADVKNEFGLSTRQANEFAISLLKLTTKAGEVEKTGDAIGALLDLAAAKGWSAEDALEAINQALMGQDEGTDKLFGKNPSVIYAEWAEKAGMAAGQMREGHKALALLDAILNDGGAVRGEYTKWLESAAGQQFLLKVKTEEAAASIGRSMEGVRMVVLPILADVAEGFTNFIGGIQLMAVDFAVVMAEMRVGWAKLQDFITGNDIADAIAGKRSRTPGDREMDARVELLRTRQVAEETRLEIVRAMELATQIAGDTNPLNKLLDTSGGGAGAKAKDLLKEEIALLGKAKELGVFRVQHLNQALELETQLAAQARNQNLQLADQVALQEKLAALRGITGINVRPQFAPVAPPSAGVPTKKNGQAILPAGRREAEPGKFLEVYRDQWLEENQAALSAAQVAAQGFSDAWTTAFQRVMQEGGGLGSFFATLGRQMFASLIQGFVQYAGVKVAENIARGFEMQAIALGLAAAGDGKGAGEAQASAIGHFVSAAKWGVAGGVGGAAAAAVSSGGGGGGGGTGGSGGSYDRAHDAAGSRGNATIVLQGSWQAMLADPHAQDAFAEMMEELSDRRVVVRYGT